MDEFLKGMLNDIYGSDLMKAVDEAVKFNPDDFKSIIDATSEIVLPIASVLVVIYFMMQLMDKLTTEQFSTDQFIKMLMKLVFAIIVITNISVWSANIMQFGVLFTDAVTQSTSVTTSFSTDDVLKDMSGFNKILTVIIMMIPWMVSMLLRVAVYFLGYGRAIEIGVRASLAPIGCADIVTGGVNSNGFKYIKKMVGVSIQGGVMMLVAGIAAVLLNNHVSEIQNLLSILTIGKYLGIAASMVGIMASSKQLAFEVVGA